MRLRSPFVALGVFAAFALGHVVGRADTPKPAQPPPAAASPKPRISPTPATLSLPALIASLLPSQPDDADSDSSPDPVASYEDLMYAQPDLVDASLHRLRAQTPGRIDLYALGFAGDGDENVFRNEVDYLPRLLAQRFGASDRTMQLINSPQTFEHTPLATRTNLYDALHGIAATMDPDEDVLLLFLTSHGSRDHQLFVQMGVMPLDQLTPKDIRDALDAVHIRWRVIVVSACYSGGFIPALKESHTMIITAARADRTSFGCGSDSQITWFGKAFLTEALNQTTDFHDAYIRASKTIATWEKRDHEKPSEPQFWEGSLVEQHLAAWRATLPVGAPVAFIPATPPTRHAGR